MAKVTRGAGGVPYDSPVTVQPPHFNGVEGDVEIICSVTRTDDGQSVKITLSHEEALQLCADWAARLLGKQVGPLTPPGLETKKVEW